MLKNVIVLTKLWLENCCVMHTYNYDSTMIKIYILKKKHELQFVKEKKILK